MSSMAAAHGLSPHGDQWAGPDYSAAGGLESQSPPDSKNASVLGMNFIKGFPGVQKKTTRDGQPAKRRGPKPDSKPAQTRRQELNRQAQRTHRERKEQYIKALEIEISRLREGYTNDISSLNTNFESHRAALRELQEENVILKEMLASRGIQYQHELESRRASGMMKHRRTSPGTGSAVPPPGLYQQMTGGSATTTAYSPQPTLPDRSFGAGGVSNVSSVSGRNAGHHHYSPTGSAVSGGQRSYSHADPGVYEQSIKLESPGVPDTAGIFEKDPNLQVEFILALEATCRDHGEYLVRRSVDSPDDPEEALFSGHALMASCPPPTHISTVPAQQGGLMPTYPHQVPPIPAVNLNTLLNLSNRIKAEGLVEGGQVTPIMALQSLRSHTHYQSLTRNDVVDMIEAIKNKVRCYGFGAVMEDFELRDALSSVFATKFETYEQAFGFDEVVPVDDL